MQDRKVFLFLYISLIVIALVFIGLFAYSGQEGNWFMGHDNGQAYRIYMEQMEQAGRWPDPDGWQ